MAKNEEMVIAKEARDRSGAELKSLLASKVDELHKAKFKHSLGQLSTTHELKSLKRDIARLKTIIGEQARAGEQQS